MATPPWEHDALPPDLTPEHFRVAAAVWVGHREQELGNDVLVPVQGQWSGDNALWGDAYPETVRRRDLLAATKPLGVLAGSITVYPVIAVYDPFNERREDAEVRPLGLIGATGYIGSVWNSHSTSWVPTVLRGVHGNPRTLFVTTVTMSTTEVWAYLPKRQRTRKNPAETYEY